MSEFKERYEHPEESKESEVIPPVETSIVVENEANSPEKFETPREELADFVDDSRRLLKELDNREMNRLSGLIEENEYHKMHKAVEELSNMSDQPEIDYEHFYEIIKSFTENLDELGRRSGSANDDMESLEYLGNTFRKIEESTERLANKLAQGKDNKDITLANACAQLSAIAIDKKRLIGARMELIDQYLGNSY